MIKTFYNYNEVADFIKTVDVMEIRESRDGRYQVAYNNNIKPESRDRYTMFQLDKNWNIIQPHLGRFALFFAIRNSGEWIFRDLEKMTVSEINRQICAPESILICMMEREQEEV